MRVSKYSEDLETAENIVSLAIKLSGVRPDLETRRRGVVAVRATVCYLIRKLTDLSLSETADYVGGKDHTTVRHYIDNKTYDSDFAEQIMFHMNHKDIPKLSVVHP